MWLPTIFVTTCFICHINAADEMRKIKVPFVADAVGNTLPPPKELPASVGSPSNLLNPDRYEFYTFDETGELIKRLMTLEEIQEIVASGDGHDGHMVTLTEQQEPILAFNLSDPSNNKVHSVVTSVQNVLKAQMEAHRNNPPVPPALDTPDVSDSWSMILPSIFGNSGLDIIPDKPPGTFGTPETETIDISTKPIENYENPLSKEEFPENSATDEPTTQQMVEALTERIISELSKTANAANVSASTIAVPFEQPKTTTYSPDTSDSPTISNYSKPSAMTTPSQPPNLSTTIFSQSPIKFSSTVNLPSTYKPSTYNSTITFKPSLTSSPQLKLKPSSTVNFLSSISNSASTYKPSTTFYPSSTSKPLPTISLLSSTHNPSSLLMQTTTLKPLAAPNPSSTINEVKSTTTKSSTIYPKETEVPEKTITKTSTKKISTTPSSTTKLDSTTDKEKEFIPTIITPSMPQSILQSTATALKVQSTTTLPKNHSITTTSKVESTPGLTVQQNSENNVSIFIPTTYKPTWFSSTPLQKISSTTEKVFVTPPAKSNISPTKPNQTKPTKIQSFTYKPLNQSKFTFKTSSKPTSTTPKAVERSTQQPITSTTMKVTTEKVTLQNEEGKPSLPEIPIFDILSSINQIAPELANNNLTTSYVNQLTSMDEKNEAYLNNLIVTTPRMTTKKVTAKPPAQKPIIISTTKPTTKRVPTVTTQGNYVKVSTFMPPTTQTQKIMKPQLTTKKNYTNINEESTPLPSFDSIFLQSSMSNLLSQVVDARPSLMLKPGENNSVATTTEGLSNRNDDMEIITTTVATSTAKTNVSWINKNATNMNETKKDPIKNSLPLNTSNTNYIEKNVTKSKLQNTENVNKNVSNATLIKVTTMPPMFTSPLRPMILINTTKAEATQKPYSMSTTKKPPMITYTAGTKKPIAVVDIQKNQSQHEKYEKNNDAKVQVKNENKIKPVSYNNELKSNLKNDVKTSLLNEKKPVPEIKPLIHNFLSQNQTINPSNSTEDKKNMTVSTISKDSTTTPLSIVKIDNIPSKPKQNISMPIQTKPSTLLHSSNEKPLTISQPQAAVKNNSLLGEKDETKKKIQKVNIAQEEGQNDPWKLISTVSPPAKQQVPTPEEKISEQKPESANDPNKLINLDSSKENQGLEATLKDLREDIYLFTELCNELAFRYWSTFTESVDKKRSFVFSPYSITSTLAMLFMGARGATSGEMNEILKLDDMVTFNPHFILKNISDSIDNAEKSGVATSAFVKELFGDRNKGRILTFYKERAQQFYSGHVEEIDFKVVNDIVRRRTNLLVKRHTWGKITEYLKSNSIYLNAPLAAFAANIYQTDCTDHTSTEGRDGEMYFVVSPTVRQRRLVPVPAVVYKSNFLAGYDPVLDATAASIGNTNSITSVIFVMPGQQGNAVHLDDLEQLEKRLLVSNPTTAAWNRLLRTLLPRFGLELQIPRFSHTSMLNVTTILKKIGLKDLFNPGMADLGGIGGMTTDLHLSDIMQSNSFATCGEHHIGEQHHTEVYPGEQISRKRSVSWSDVWGEPRDYQMAFHDPNDIVGAALLPLHLRPRQARLPDYRPNNYRTYTTTARLKFDRPYLYFVRHNPSGMILYVGRYNPRLLP